MGLFDRFRKPTRTYQDPMFGELKHEYGAWCGTLHDSPLGQDVAISIQSDGAEPNESHRTVFRDLVARWSSLQPEIADALFSLWAPYLDEWSADDPPIVTSRDTILRYTTLHSVDIGSGPVVVLGYGFLEEVGWDDALLSVEIAGGCVAARSLDD